MQKKRLMIIGAGGVGNVAVRKSARMEDIYEEILLASRTKEKCDAIAKESGPVPVRTASIDADDVDALVRMIKEFKADLVPAFSATRLMLLCSRPSSCSK